MAEELKVYSVRETAEELKVSERLVQRLARSGKLKGVKVGRSWRFTLESIRAYLAGGYESWRRI